MKESYSFLEDPKSVLERLGGNEPMLSRLLVKFHDTYRSAREQFRAHLASGEREEAWRLIHSIKGVSANLGIGSLYRSSIALETRMKNGEYLSMQAEADAFFGDLDSVLLELERKHIPEKV